MIISEKKQKVSSPAQVADLLRSILMEEDLESREREHFWSVGLNSKNVVQYVELVSLGTLAGSLVHPRETFRLAVMKGISSIIVGHNHPSGDVAPSQDDLTITQRLRDAGSILGIEVLDHVIIGTGSNHPGYFGFRDNNLF